MIRNDREFQATLNRIGFLQQQVTNIRQRETRPTNYRACVGGFLAEIDRMQFEVREYLSVLPTTR